MVLLVATDLLDSSTQIQLEWVAEVMKSGPNDLEVIIRPHPASDFSSKKYLKWQASVDRTDLSLLLKRIDVIFCSNASSIAMDGYLAGKTILTMLNGETFNFSPMRGLNCSINITSPEELRASLSTSTFNNTNKKNKLFCLSKKLQKWEKLISKFSPIF